MGRAALRRWIEQPLAGLGDPCPAREAVSALVAQGVPCVSPCAPCMRADGGSWSGLAGRAGRAAASARDLVA